MTLPFRSPRARRRIQIFSVGLSLLGGLSAAHAQSIRVVETTADQSQLLSPQANAQFLPGTGSQLPITVDDSVQYQRLEGVGATFNDSGAYLVWNNLTAVQRASLMNDLFSPDGIHLSYLRQPMGATDLSLSSYTYDDLAPGSTDPDMQQFSIAHDKAYIIPTIQAALAVNPNLKVFALPWSPPAWMKTSGSLNGGTINPANFPALAKYFTKFVQAYEANGIPIDYVAVQNEPRNENGGYPTTFVNVADEGRFIAGYLGPALEKMHPRHPEGQPTARPEVTPGILGYEHNWDDPKYPETLASNPAVRRYLAGVSFHCYEGKGPDAQNAVHDLDNSIPIYFTECTGGSYAPVFADNLAYDMQHEVIEVLRNWGKSVTFWNLDLDQNAGPTVEHGCSNCRGVVTVDTSTTPATVTRNVEYYVLGQLSKFVQAGAYRVGSNSYGDGNLQDVAFKNPDGSIAVLVFNGAASASAFSLNWKGNTTSYTLPPGAVATFVWAGHPGNTFDVTAGPPSEIVAPGTATDYGVTVNRYGSDRGPVRLAVNGLPSGAFGQLVPLDFSSGQYLLPVETFASAPAGTYPVTITGTQGNTQASSTVQLTVGGKETPFGGTPWTLPGLVQAENFDEGGLGVGYFNLDTTNQGMTTYRGTATVGVEATGDTGGGYDVGYTDEGEWLRYTVDVTQAGTYQFLARAASLGQGGYFHVSFDGQNATGTLFTPATYGFQLYTTMVSPAFNLRPGRHVMQVTLDGNGPTAGMGNFNWFAVQPFAASTPFGGTPWAVPGQIEVENFDAGGKSVGYWNGATANTGGANVRPGETVSIENCSDTGGGFDVGNLNPGDWLNYSVNISTARAYTLHARVAIAVGGGVFHLAVDGQRVTGPISVPETTGWQTWQTLDIPGVELPQGRHTLQLVMDSGGFYNTVGNLNWFALD